MKDSKAERTLKSSLMVCTKVQQYDASKSDDVTRQSSYIMM